MTNQSAAKHKNIGIANFSIKHSMDNEKLAIKWYNLLLLFLPIICKLY
jgi:hypothetical protein